MKTRSLLQAMFLLLSLSLVAVSCDDDDDNNTGPQNIAQIVATNPNFSILNAAINRAGLGSALSSGTLTVFAPDNAAFAAAGISEAAIPTLRTTFLDSVLKYHVLGSRVISTAVPVSDDVATLLGTQLYASRNANGVFANGIKVKSADIEASNGVVHVIENVLIPPTRTIAQIATADTTFSLLVAAVTKAGLVGAISGAGNLTVFAPTNAAFRAAGFPNAAAIDAAPTATVLTIVSRHVVNTNVFASDLTEGGSLPTLQGGPLTVNLGPPRVRVTGSSATPSAIVAANIAATNGVVHVIDRVLLP